MTLRVNLYFHYTAAAAAQGVVEGFGQKYNNNINEVHAKVS